MFSDAFTNNPDDWMKIFTLEQAAASVIAVNIDIIKRHDTNKTKRIIASRLMKLRQERQLLSTDVSIEDIHWFVDKTAARITSDIKISPQTTEKELLTSAGSSLYLNTGTLIECCKTSAEFSNYIHKMAKQS